MLLRDERMCKLKRGRECVCCVTDKNDIEKNVTVDVKSILLLKFLASSIHVNNVSGLLLAQNLLFSCLLFMS